MTPTTWGVWFLSENLCVSFQAWPHAITMALPGRKLPSPHRLGAWPVSALQYLKEDAVKDTPPMASHALVFICTLTPEALSRGLIWPLLLRSPYGRGKGGERRKPWRHYAPLWLSTCTYFSTPNPPPHPTSHIRIHNIIKVFCWGLSQ